MRLVINLLLDLLKYIIHQDIELIKMKVVMNIIFNKVLPLIHNLIILEFRLFF